MNFPLKTRARRFAAVGLTVGLAVGSGIAIASWSSSGSGSGTAKAVTATALTTTSATPSAQLYPGGTGDLSITIKNDNPYPVTVSSIVQDGTVTSNTTGCTTAGVSLADITGVTDTVPANGSASFTHAGKVSMDNTSQDACQGAVFTIPVKLSGASS